MTDKNRNLLVRVVSAVVLLPLILWLLYMDGAYTAGLLAVAAGACALEYYAIVYPRLSPASIVGALVSASLPVLAVAYPSERALAFSALLVVVLFLASWAWFLFMGPHADAPARVGHLLSGALFGGIGLSAVAWLRQFPSGFGWVVVALAITWSNDTLAYFAGRFFGRHKLFPAISPNKTWEGFFGGMLGSIAGVFVVRAIFFQSSLTVGDCLFLGVGGGVLGPVGDLCESMLKRAYQAKDSGKLIPGHGGLLDRIDALLFNAPLVLFYLFTQQ